MVLIEKALSMQRRGVDAAAYTGVDAAEDTWVTKNFDDQIRQIMAMVTGFVVRLADNIQKYMVSVNTAVLTTLKEPVKPRFGYQIAVALEREMVKKPKLGGLGLENTNLYDMEPFTGPEKHIDFGIDLYDIESNWK
jgi:hypothetical protein